MRIHMLSFGAKDLNSEPLQTLGGKIHENQEQSQESPQHSSSTQQQCEENNVGGQAIIEGIMMRSKNSYALAVRLPNGSIQVESKKWYKFSKSSLSEKPFFRGFPVLVETLINGIRTLNRSAELNSLEDENPLTDKQLFFTLLAAIAMAVGLFVILPHGLSAVMQYFGYSGGVESFSFQVWDGLFKFLVFFLYLFLIAFVPEVKRVFQFHGAEHKVIAAYEKAQLGQDVNISFARKQSRLHPRCGTTFLLFVLSIAIIVHTILLPPLLWLWAPQSTVYTHTATLIIKILLIAPISAIAYELIRYSSKLHSFWGYMLKAPGLLLQYFTTREPDDEHLEVALVALKEALGNNASHTIITCDYKTSE